MMEVALFVGVLVLMCLPPVLMVYAGRRHVSKSLDAIASMHNGRMAQGPTSSRYQKMVTVPQGDAQSLQFWFEGRSSATTHLVSGCALPEGWGAFEVRTWPRQFAYAVDEGEVVVETHDAAFNQTFVVTTNMPEVAMRVLTSSVLVVHGQHPHLRLKMVEGHLQLTSVHKSPTPELVEVMMVLTNMYRDAVIACE